MRTRTTADADQPAEETDPVRHNPREGREAPAERRDEDAPDPTRSSHRRVQRVRDEHVRHVHD